MCKLGLSVWLAFCLSIFGVSVAIATAPHVNSPMPVSSALPVEQAVMKFCGGASGRCYRKCDSNPDLSKRVCHCYCKQDDGTIWTKW